MIAPITEPCIPVQPAGPSARVTATKSGPKNTRSTPSIENRASARGEASASSIVRYSRAASGDTGRPGRNFRTFGLGVVSVWMNMPSRCAPNACFATARRRARASGEVLEFGVGQVAGDHGDRQLVAADAQALLGDRGDQRPGPAPAGRGRQNQDLDLRIALHRLADAGAGVALLDQEQRLGAGQLGRLLAQLAQQAFGLVAPLARDLLAGARPRPAERRGRGSG